MVAPNANTFDLATPRRPGSNDFNGIAKGDDPNNVPDPTSMPNAAEWNTLEFLMLAASRVMPVLVLSILGSATPTVNQFPSARSTLILSNLTVTRNGAGDVSITWPANTFPPSASPPVACLNGPTAGQISCDIIANGVRVYTFNSAGAATDRNFTVQVF